jgi:hypothetical protein
MVAVVIHLAGSNYFEGKPDGMVCDREGINLVIAALYLSIRRVDSV